jgi:hypothetical protein
MDRAQMASMLMLPLPSLENVNNDDGHHMIAD